VPAVKRQRSWPVTASIAWTCSPAPMNTTSSSPIVPIVAEDAAG